MGKSWQKVGTMADSNGSLKYPQLLALMKCVLSFSRENAVPERDFYEQDMFKSQVYTINNDNIDALHY